MEVGDRAAESPPETRKRVALRVIAPDVIGLPIELEHFDLSLANRRATKNALVYEAAMAMKRAKLGLKAATITPEGRKRWTRRPAVTRASPTSRS